MAGKWVNGEWYSERDLAVTGFLQAVFYKLETGNEKAIQSSATYKAQGPKLTDKDVDRVIEALDAEYDMEMLKYPSYHWDHAQAKTTPDFFRLGKRARRAVVEGVRQIIETTVNDPNPAMNPGYQVMEQYGEFC